MIVVKAGFVLIFVFLVISFSFFTSDKVLQNFYRVVDNTNFLIQTQVEDPVDVREVNLKINEVERIKKKSFDWLELFGAVSEILPEDIYVESLRVDKEEGLASLTGLALSRESLVSLRDELERSEYFYSPDMPLDSILKREDINFDIKVRINTEKFN